MQIYDLKQVWSLTSFSMRNLMDVLLMSEIHLLPENVSPSEIF
jgi:hypothetical protein